MKRKNFNNLSITYAPHAVTDVDTKKVMLTVILALLPAMGVGVYQFGYQALIQIVLCIAACMGFEWAYNKIAKTPQTVGDLSAALTGVLLACNIPAGLPYWMTIVGCFIAIVIVKFLLKEGVEPIIVAQANKLSLETVLQLQKEIELQNA